MRTSGGGPKRIVTVLNSSFKWKSENHLAKILMAGLHPRPIISVSLWGGALTAVFQSFPGSSYMQPGLRITGLKQELEWDNKQTHLQLFSNFIMGKSHPESLLKLWILPNPPHTTPQIRFSWSEWALGIYNHNKLPCGPEAGETLVRRWLMRTLKKNRGGNAMLRITLLALVQSKGTKTQSWKR